MEGAKYPLQILPNELWELIILEVKDSEDLRSLMKASKQLNDIFMRIHHLWLLDKVLPCLLPTTKPKSKHYLEVKDLNNLRLVDKRWSRAANTFLENQPVFRPYNKNDNNLNSEAHIWSDLCFEDEWEFLEKGIVTLPSYSKIDEFHQVFRNSERSPFPARSIVGQAQPNPSGEDKKKFWEEMRQKVFQKFGKDVWFFKMEFFKMEWEEDYLDRDENRDEAQWDQRSTWKWIVNSLSSLPYLKSLNIEIDFYIREYPMNNSAAKRFLKLPGNKLPPLPFLEALIIQQEGELPPLFTLKLLSEYSGQLRRLQIGTVDWSSRRKWKLPNLTELHLNQVIHVKKHISTILRSLEAPQLAKLKLTGYKNNMRLSVLRMEEDIFPWIDLFPSLLHLDISYTNCDLTESGKLNPTKDSKLFLKYLKISVSHQLTYNFLRCFPNLERLLICFDHSGSKVTGLKMNTTLYKLDVWEVLPKLRTLSIIDHGREEVPHYEFDRGTYEKFKKEAELTGHAQLSYGICNIYDLNQVSEDSDENVTETSEGESE